MDGNRGVEIVSNILNLPDFVYVGGKTLTYSCDGAGTKHKYVADTLTIGNYKLENFTKDFAEAYQHG